MAATVVGLIAARIALQALNSPQAGLDDFMPAVFLAFFAFMLFKAAGDARKPGKPPAGKLPPLKSTYRKDGWQQPGLARPLPAWPARCGLPAAADRIRLARCGVRPAARPAPGHGRRNATEC